MKLLQQKKELKHLEDGWEVKDRMYYLKNNKSFLDLLNKR
jgi:hypothetical protein